MTILVIVALTIQLLRVTYLFTYCQSDLQEFAVTMFTPKVSVQCMQAIIAGCGRNLPWPATAKQTDGRDGLWHRQCRQMPRVYDVEGAYAKDGCKTF